ncbi:uncharacterized protein LOC117343632 isoform X2 [Pecten maximus]|nr:uncharacterized protein LOC117343632 isoform X2 [Pecten maximus]
MCKPMTKCKQDEVVIIDGNKTRDSVCIPRYQDTVYLSNFKTTSQPSRVIVTRFNDTEILNAVFICTVCMSVLITGIAVLTACMLKYRRLKRTESPAFPEEKQECLSTCESDCLEEDRICSDSRILHNDTKNKQCSVRIERNGDRIFPGVCLDRSPENISDDNNVHLNVFYLGSSPECLLLTEAKAIPTTRPSPLSLENETSFTLAKYNESEETVLITDNDELFGEAETFQCSHLPAQKTILSTDWQWGERITNQGCSLQLPNSDIITTFPPGVLSDCGSYAYCHKAVHNNILRLAAELCLPFDTVITSPSPEYHMKTTLAKFVQVNIPHRMRKNYKNIEVLSFSKQAGSKVKLVEVPKYYDRSEADDKLDMFCVINSESVDIHTKHFSGFVCTLCKKYIEYNLSASIYGRKGLIDNRIVILDILLYLKGAKSSIADFEAIVEDKVDERFHHLETTRVKLLTQHEQRKGGQLQFNFGLVSESVQTWTHRKAENGDQFVDTLVLANPEDLMLECEKHIICCPGTKWYLQRQGRIKSNCDFYVKIIHKEKPPTALSTLHHINTYIPACEDFCISGALSFASESAGVVSVGAASSQASQLPVPPFGTHTSNVNTEDVYRQNTATIPGAITDVVLTLNRHLSQQDSLQLVKHMGCLGHIPPTEDR